MNGHSDVAQENGFAFLERVANLIMHKYKIVGNSKWIAKNNPKVINFVQPDKLKEILNLQIKEEKQSEDEILKLCEKVIEYDPKTSHPMFYNQLYAGVDQYGLAGSWLTDTLNTSIATYETSPVFTLMEIELVKFSCSKIGWDIGLSDGVFAPGGSISNLFGMMCARHYFFPEIKKKGSSHLKQLVLFASDNSHYSYSKGAMTMGIGMDCVIKVPTDDYGRMLPDKLDELIQKSIENDQIPFMVGCTSGTTVFCAFDNLKEINKICSKYKLWMHVDACLGGTVMLSSKHRYLVEGIENANSVSWNFHKMTGSPLQSSLFLVREKRVLKDTMSLNAEYLFQSDKSYDSNYDLGDKTIQCGRKVDSLKNWIMLALKGEKELERLVNKVFEVKEYFISQIKQRANFKLVLDKFEGNTISFWYLPPSLMKLGWENVKPELLHQVCPKLKDKMLVEGTMMINYQPSTTKKLPNFWRIVLTCNPEVEKNEMDFVLKEFERLGRDLIFLIKFLKFVIIKNL